MNQRLNELAMQANGHHDNFFDLNYKELDIFLEKFAEMIVRECAAHLHRRGVEGFGILEERNLKEHFGVES